MKHIRMAMLTGLAAFGLLIYSVLASSNSCPIKSAYFVNGTIEATLSQTGASLRIMFSSDPVLHRTRSHADQKLVFRSEGYVCGLDGPGTNYYIIVHLNPSKPGLGIRSPTYDDPEIFVPARRK